MKLLRCFLPLSLLTLVLTGCQSATQPPQTSAPPPPVAPMKLGVEVLFEKHLDLLRGKRVGLITNPSGTTRNLDSIIELFRAHPDVKLVALYGPEHGVRGNAQAGEYVAFYYDEQFKLPVFSLYGQSHRPPPDMLSNIDEYMRNFDTNDTGKRIERDMVQAIDVMVFDLQDVGTRVYTYIATMAYAMEAAAEQGIPFVVLDRPNPINGVTMDGPILQPKFSSFIGLYPIPLQHGMTTGELARLFNDKFLKKKAELTVVPMEGWRRTDWFDDTGLPWVLPSPNLPTPDSAVVYPGQVIFEGTNLSEGRGTTKPFELFGAPWIDGYTLARELNALQLPGVRFREAWFTPTFSKFKGERCGGCQLHVTDRAAYRSIPTTLAILQTVKRLYGDHLKLHDRYFDKVMGTSEVREALLRGEPWERIVAGWEAGLREFAALREPYLLYR
ncbi:MAG: exo-beta-N-acetylmuramidase NamZ domain-containing protein [Limisphaerales bacterium]